MPVCPQVSVDSGVSCAAGTKEDNRNVLGHVSSTVMLRCRNVSDLGSWLSAAAAKLESPLAQGHEEIWDLPLFFGGSTGFRSREVAGPAPSPWDSFGMQGLLASVEILLGPISWEAGVVSRYILANDSRASHGSALVAPDRDTRHRHA